MINKQNSEFESTPQKEKKIIIPFRGEKIAQISRNVRDDKCNAKKRI
jgi:hypothetical protein